MSGMACLLVIQIEIQAVCVHISSLGFWLDKQFSDGVLGVLSKDNIDGPDGM